MLFLISFALLTTFGYAKTGDQEDAQDNDKKVAVTNKKMKDIQSFRLKNTTRLSDKLSKKEGDFQTLKKEKLQSPQHKNEGGLKGEQDSKVVTDKERKDMSSPAFKNKKHFRK